MRWLAMLLALVATPAWAGLDVPPDTSALQAQIGAVEETAQTASYRATSALTSNDANQLITTAIAPLATASALTAGLAQIPPACSTAPPMDTINGSAGTAAACAPRSDASRPAVVQTATAAGGAAIVTDSTGAFAGVWPRAWALAPSYAHAEVYTTSNPILCMIGTATATAVAGKCFALQPTTLPATLALLQSYVVTPFANAAAGLTVKVVGRQ